MIFENALNDIAAAAVIGLAGFVWNTRSNVLTLSSKLDNFIANEHKEGMDMTVKVAALTNTVENHGVRIALTEQAMVTLSTLSADLKAVVQVSTRTNTLLEAVHRRLEILEELTIKKG